MPKSLIIVLLFLFRQAQLCSQTVSEDPVAEATALLNDGKAPAAVLLLERHLQLHPNDAFGHWILGRALYWSGRPDAARLNYERALSLDASQAWLRIEFARMLAETHQPDRGRTVLSPILNHPEAGPDAAALFGTLAYWEGDWTSATEHFEAALSRNPLHSEARRQLNEIRFTTAPIVAVTGDYESDTQPLKRLILSVEGVWNFTPLQALIARVRHQNVSISDSLRQVLALELGLKQYFPSMRLETDASIGLVDRSFTRKKDLTWRIGLGIRISQHWTVRVRGERSPYFQTSSSYLTPLSTRTVGADVDWSSATGGAGKVGFDVIRFPDSNTLNRALLWFLTPLVRSTHVEISAGYGFNYQDTEENRFRLDTELSGTYDPYYTPLNLQSHSLLALVILKPSALMTFRINGAFGIYATENSPFSTSSTSLPGQGRPSRSTETTLTRSSNPWNVEAVIGGPLGSALMWSLEGRYWSNLFYDLRHITLRFSYRILPSGVDANSSSRR